MSAAWGRFDVTRLVLKQRQRLCVELASRGIDAVSLIVADDENLEIASEYDCDVVEMPNKPLGKKCNAGLQSAARQGFDWIVWVGSDDWIHPAVFDPLLHRPADAPVTIITGRRIAIVDLASGMLQRVSSPSKFGAIPWLIDGRLFSTRKVEPIRPDLARGLDGSLMRGLRRAREPFEVVFDDPHDFRCVDFKGANNITPYKGIAKHLGVGEPEQAWDALRGWFDDDLIDQARTLFPAVREPLAQEA